MPRRALQALMDLAVAVAAVASTPRQTPLAATAATALSSFASTTSNTVKPRKHPALAESFQELRKTARIMLYTRLLKAEHSRLPKA